MKTLFLIFLKITDLFQIIASHLMRLRMQMRLIGNCLVNGMNGMKKMKVWNETGKRILTSEQERLMKIENEARERENRPKLRTKDWTEINTPLEAMAKYWDEGVKDENGKRPS